MERGKHETRKTEKGRERIGKTLSRKLENGRTESRQTGEYPPHQQLTLHGNRCLSGTPEESGKNPGDEVQQTAGSCRPWNRGSSEGNVPWISLCGNVPNHSGSPRQGHIQNRRKVPALSRHADSVGRRQIVKAPKIVDLALEEKPTSELTVENVKIFGMKVDGEQVLKDVHAVNPEVTILARCGKRVVENEDTEQTTGFA